MVVQPIKAPQAWRDISVADLHPMPLFGLCTAE